MRGALCKTRRILRKKTANQKQKQRQRAGKHATVRNVLRQAERTPLSVVGPTHSAVHNVLNPISSVPTPTLPEPTDERHPITSQEP